MTLALGAFQNEAKAEWVGSHYFQYTLRLNGAGSPFVYRSEPFGGLLFGPPAEPGAPLYTIAPIAAPGISMPDGSFLVDVDETRASGTGDISSIQEAGKRDKEGWNDYEIVMTTKPTESYSEVLHLSLGVGIFSDEFKFGWTVRWKLLVRDWVNEIYTQEEKDAAAAWDAAFEANPNDPNLGERPNDYYADMPPQPGPLSSAACGSALAAYEAAMQAYYEAMGQWIIDKRNGIIRPKPTMPPPPPPDDECWVEKGSGSFDPRGTISVDSDTGVVTRNPESPVVVTQTASIGISTPVTILYAKPTKTTMADGYRLEVEVSEPDADNTHVQIILTHAIHDLGSVKKEKYEPA